MGDGQLAATGLPRLMAVEVLLAEPEELQDDVLETCLYILRDRLRGDQEGVDGDGAVGAADQGVDVESVDGVP
jgi:hypothetical protein